MKQVIIAENQGFCMGVRRALETVAKYPRVSILGDLIHNKQVVAKLESEGKNVINEVTGQEDHPIVITAHGVTIEAFEQLQRLNLEIIDTTCPLVRAIYRKGEKLEEQGYHILIIGDKNHVEVKGIASRMKDPIIINNPDELSGLELPQRIGVICQSTILRDKFESIVHEIKKKRVDVKVENTICAATTQHQAAAEALAHKVDLMIVVGGYHSSNTKKLAALTSRYVQTHHIETAAELKLNWFTGKNMIGIAAGASTPDWIIDDVAKTISAME